MPAWVATDKLNGGGAIWWRLRYLARGPNSVANEYWFYFDLYEKTRWVGRSRVFKIKGMDTRREACAAAEEAWLTTGALRGDAFELVEGEVGIGPDRYVLRDHEGSPTKT